MKAPRRDIQTLFTVGSVGRLSDGKLLERFTADRDEAAFEAVVVRHGPMVWGVCRRILRDPNDAEDAFQATFLVLARKAASIAHREMLANWLLWLPIDRSVNVQLKDGTRGYGLTRFFTAPDKPRDVRVHVHGDDSGSLPPDWLRTIWPFAFDNRRDLKLVPPGPGTPEGWVAIKVEYPQIQYLYHADRAHGYAVARMVEWSSLDGGRMKFRTESKALRWAQLPGGAWYVTAWKRLHHLDKLDASGKPDANPQPDYTTLRRVTITPMDPETFPPGIFAGGGFLDAARKEGAKIKVD